MGEARCEKCHAAIFRDSLASRHTQTYYRGTARRDPAPGPAPARPRRPRGDPHNPTARRRRSAKRRASGREVFDAVIEYAFGTSDRYLTMVSRDASGGYHIARLSYYQTPEGKGWDRSTLDKIHPTRAHPAGFQGETIGVRDGLAKCLYCHVTNPRTGHDSIGPETADRAIGCERCHGPGGNHIAALQAGLPDPAIVNPAGASPEAVTSKQCNDCHILAEGLPRRRSGKPGLGPLRRGSAGRAAAAIPRAAARSAASPATIPTKRPRHEHRRLRGQMPHVPRLDEPARGQGRAPGRRPRRRRTASPHVPRQPVKRMSRVSHAPRYGSTRSTWT